MASMNVVSSKAVPARATARGALVPKLMLVPAGRVSIVRSKQQEDRQHVRSQHSGRRDVRMLSMAGAGSGMSPELKRSVDEFVTSNKVVVFMKGTKQAPQCGFSAKVVQILSAMDVNFETINILEDERLRSGMKEYSQWPTFPQVYINGEFYGGADITLEAAQNGQLKEALEVALME